MKGRRVADGTDPVHYQPGDYGRWYKLPYAICYFYNAFGPRERGEGKYATVIAKFEQQYLRGEPLTVVKPGTQRRAFTYGRVVVM